MILQKLLSMTHLKEMFKNKRRTNKKKEKDLGQIPSIPDLLHYKVNSKPSNVNLLNSIGDTLLLLLLLFSGPSLGLIIAQFAPERLPALPEKSEMN